MSKFPERASVQSDCIASNLLGRMINANGGTVAWAEHVEAWEKYAERFGRGQSALRMHERGGFGRFELWALLGREPATFIPHGAETELEKLKQENERLKQRIAELEEAASMACEEPASDCECAGCMRTAEYAAAWVEKEKTRNRDNDG